MKWADGNFLRNLRRKLNLAAWQIKLRPNQRPPPQPDLLLPAMALGVMLAKQAEAIGFLLVAAD